MLIEKVKPCILAIQETKLPRNIKINIRHYNIFNTEGHHNRTEHEGAALLIHEEIPMRLVNSTTDLQAIAMEVYIDRPMTVCSIYNSENHSLTEELLNNLIRQRPQPVMIMGNFNAYSKNWGCDKAGPRGRIVE